MSVRVLIAEPNEDVRSLLELTVSRLGYEPLSEQTSSGRIDAVIVEPGCAVARSVLGRLGDSSTPIICLSIYPREQGLEPAESVAYLVKPASTQQIADALRAALAD